MGKGRHRRVIPWIALSCLVLGACSDDPSGVAPTTGPSSTATPGTDAPSTTSTTIRPPGDTSVPPNTVPPSVPVPHYVDETGFDDHSVPSVATQDELLALSRTGVGGQSVMKFVLPEFDRPADSPGLTRAFLMDSGFYELHDEWWWFRLLNGRAVPGDDTVPLTERRFGSVGEIEQWARSLPPSKLPLGLKFVGDRLYSEGFYDLALHAEPRTLGVGSIVRFPDTTGAVHWLLELEYSDVVTPEHIAQFFDRLRPVLPADVWDRLEWVIRSPQHEQVAEQMAAGSLPYGDRVVQYSDLVPAGQVGVYSEGITAGRLLYVGDDGADLASATPTDIVVTEHVPDWLPQAAALITSDPQTPLAHVSLLARNRRIPDVSRSGVHVDAGIRQAARVRAYAIVLARDGRLTVALITKEQYAAWQRGDDIAPLSLPAVDTSSMPLVVDLTAEAARLSSGGLTADEVDRWVPVIGGKATGFLTLLSTPGIDPPPTPLAITVRPYLEHLAPLRSTIAAVLDDPSMDDDPRVRWLVLEGDDDYADVFASDSDAAFAEQFLADHPEGTPLGDVLAAGGVREYVEDAPIDPATLRAITDQLERTYGDYAETTGLRFRSSSSVEDVEGFNGAGLYTSYTGYLHPEGAADPDDRDKTIESAIQKAWASYWSFEAFEERRAERIDQLSGAMGLVVHARFDDDLEHDNGVATFTYLPRAQGEPIDDDAELQINVQVGATDVTNPDGGSLPEVIVVRREAGQLTIERTSPSTLVTPGGQVLDDAAVRELFEQTAAVADIWRTRANAALTPAQQMQTVVLDFEFKHVEAGWPALQPGRTPFPARLVLRQVRGLDPGMRRLPEAARDLAVPLDVLMRASQIEAGTCTGASGKVYSGIVVHTDPLLAPDMGFADTPWQQGDALPNGSACNATRTDSVSYTSPDRALAALIDGGAAFVVLDG
ncbi:MAG: PEP/pyruvate-binding domain-containing protein [Acidimicrobiales bacterium]